jgi:hypothetical protein
MEDAPLNARPRKAVTRAEEPNHRENPSDLVFSIARIHSQDQQNNRSKERRPKTHD